MFGGEIARLVAFQGRNRGGGGEVRRCFMRRKVREKWSRNGYSLEGTGTMPVTPKIGEIAEEGCRRDTKRRKRVVWIEKTEYPSKGKKGGVGPRTWEDGGGTTKKEGFRSTDQWGAVKG